jgi:hypothetical protein
MFFAATNIIAQTIYTWNVSSGSWTTADNWTPARALPLLDDILVLDGSTQATPTITDIPTETIGALRFLNNVSANLSAAAANTLTIGNLFVSAPHFSVASGSTLSVSGVNVVTFSIATIFSGEVYGNIVFGGTAHELFSADANSLRFKNGSIFTATTGFTSFAFGSTNLNSVIFESGSTYINAAGSNPFGASAPNAVTIFQAGSLYSHRQTLAPALSGRTYANFEINAAGFTQANMTGINPFRCDTFTVTNATTANFNLTGGIIVSGDLKILAGAVSFSPASSNTILFDGNGIKQNVTGTFALNSNTQFIVAKTAYVDIQTNISLPDSVSVYGKLFTNTQTVSGTFFGLHPSAGAAATTGNVTLNSNTISNVAAGASNFLPGTEITGTGIPANTYVLNGYGTTLKISRFATATNAGVAITPLSSIGTLGIGSVNGITAAPAVSGNIQTTTRSFETDGTYEYNGTVAQLTGDGLPASISGSLKINNTSTAPSSGVTLSQNATVTGSFEIIQGNTTLGINDLVVNAIIQTNATTLIDNHIVTDNAGSLTIKSVGAGPVNFPVGPSADSLNTLKITNGGSSDYSLKINKDIIPSIAFPTYGINRTWNLKASVLTAGVTVGFQYETTDANTNVPQPQNMEILMNTNPGPVWNIMAGNGSIAPSGPAPTWLVTSATALSINNIFTPYAIGKAGGYILPLDCIISCRSRKINNNGIISWDINSCSAVNSFEVQRSVNGGAYQTVSTVTPGTQLEYSYTDASLAKGTNLYRIKVNRSSGAIKYSNTVAVINDTKGILITSLMPNPVNDKAMLIINAAKTGSVNFTIYDITGRPVKQWQTSIAEGSNNITVNANGLSNGVYHLAAIADDSKTVIRFVKQ